MSENHAELATVTTIDATPGLSAEIANMSSGNLNVFSTITGTDFKSRVAVVNALTNAVQAADNLDKTIQLKDVVVQSVILPNQQTGELEEVPRITLIDADGSAYATTSGPVFKDLKNIFAILGMPSNWPAPLPVKVSKEKAKGAGHYFTLSIAEAGAAK